MVMQKLAQDPIFASSVKQRAQMFDSGQAIRPVPATHHLPPPPHNIPLTARQFPFPNADLATSRKQSSPYLVPSAAQDFGSTVEKKAAFEPVSESRIQLQSRRDTQPLTRGKNESLIHPTRTSSLQPLSQTLPPIPPSELPKVEQFVVRDLDRYPHGRDLPASAFLISHKEQLPVSFLGLTQSSSNAISTTLPASTISASSPSTPSSPTSTASTAYSSPHSSDETSSSLERHSAAIRVESRKIPSKEAILPNFKLDMAAAKDDALKKPLQTNTAGLDDVNYSLSSVSAPKSPVLALGQLFTWKTKTDPNHSETCSPTTIPHDAAADPPCGQTLELRNIKNMPTALDVFKANDSAMNSYEILPSLLPTPPATNSHVAALELELAELTAELASSIRREMELEDEVDRLQTLLPDQTADEPGRRTSDYYSDSNTSYSRFTDADGRSDDVGQVKRKFEQEKAQLKLEMSSRMAEILKQRRFAEDRVMLLEECMQTNNKPLPPIFDHDRARQLESHARTMDRKLAEERASRDNIEELVVGMRDEIRECRAERDNLKDEIVPYYKSQIASLELFMTQCHIFTSAGPTHEHLELSPEGQASPSANTHAELPRTKLLVNTRNPSSTSPRFNSLAGHGTTGLRIGSIRDYSAESREQLLERVRDVEGQREALHQALKSLLHKYRWQQADCQNRIRVTEQQRDQAMLATPKRVALDEQVKQLREEIASLRARADGAIVQRWRCDKGLKGLKLDLDRGRHETSSLRGILARDDGHSLAGQSIDGDMSLNKAYQELKTTHVLSMVHLNGTTGSPQLSTTESSVLELLKKSISDVEAERDVAQQQAERYRDQAHQIQQPAIQDGYKENDIAAELFGSASNLDELAAQVQAQMKTNSDLQSRLGQAVERVERDQKESAARIAKLQGRLKELEEKMISAQQTSDAAMSSHEESGRLIGMGKRDRLRRSPNPTNLLSPASAKKSPYLGSFSPTGLFALHSPQLELTSSGVNMNMSQAMGTYHLQKRVKELEKALSEAECEMTEVIGRMNFAQMEVANLQCERDEATQRSKRLQADIVSERKKVQALISRTG